MNTHLINLGFIFASGALAVWCFRNNMKASGWLNLFASSINTAYVATLLINGKVRSRGWIWFLSFDSDLDFCVQVCYYKHT